MTGDMVLHEPKMWDLTAVGLQLHDPDIPYKDFEHLCAILGAMHEAVRFAIGDAIIQGEYLFGEKSFQAFERFQLSEEAMKEYVRVAQRVPRARRMKGLSWSHHRAVAPLEPAQQKEWLARSADEHLSHAALRDALRNGRVPVARDICPTCGKRL